MSFWSSIKNFTGLKKAQRASDKPPLTLKERFTALKNIPAFLRLIWQTNPALAAGNVFLRLIRSAIPLATLYIAKLIIDEVIRIAQSSADTNTTYLLTLIGLEFGLAIVSDILNRATALLDSLLGDLFANQTSVDLMQHAATLDQKDMRVQSK